MAAFWATYAGLEGVIAHPAAFYHDNPFHRRLWGRRRVR